MELILMRHGTTQGNLERRFIGTLDVPLLPQGEELARRVGSNGYRAVGTAVGHNPIPIIIPCHRVVGTNGSLTGYAGGLDKKIWLLEHEGMDMTRVYRPKKGTAL